MIEYDQTFDPNILIGHYALISWFSDFALYLGTQSVYEQTSFTLCLRMTRPSGCQPIPIFLLNSYILGPNPIFLSTSYIPINSPIF